MSYQDLLYSVAQAREQLNLARYDAAAFVGRRHVIDERVAADVDLNGEIVWVVTGPRYREVSNRQGWAIDRLIPSTRTVDVIDECEGLPRVVDEALRRLRYAVSNLARAQANLADIGPAEQAAGQPYVALVGTRRSI